MERCWSEMPLAVLSDVTDKIEMAEARCRMSDVHVRRPDHFLVPNTYLVCLSSVRGFIRSF